MKYALFLSLFFVACNPAVPKKQLASSTYFDLKGYMNSEIKRLSGLNPEIDKTVMVNKAEEHKTLKIRNWQKELSAFTDADINKSAWQGLFTQRKTQDQEVYTSQDEKVPVQTLTIHFKQGRIAAIQVLIHNANALYTSNDTLSYFPDSLYEVKKTQHIRLLNEKSYRITGKFSQPIQQN